MGFEEIVERILSSRKELTRDKLLEMIEEKKESAEGYFTDEVAARIVALDLGVEVPWWEPFRPEVLIRDLVSGLTDVTVVGRVITTYPVQTFTRPDGTEGRVTRLLIADKTGTLEVVLWDDQASLAESGKVKEGEIIKVSHGYVRQGLDGKLELHVGTRGVVQISPSGVVESEYPSVTQFIQKIEEITGEHRKASVVGVVQSVQSVSEFKRSDGTSGKVRRLLLRDETGQITVVFWNANVDQLGEVKKGDCLQLLNARVKEKLDGQIELHAENRAQIKTLAEAPFSIQLPPYEEVTMKIAEVKEGGPFTVRGTIARTPTVREVVTARNEKVTVASFELGDDTGKIRVSAWRRLADLVKDLTAGTQVEIKNAYARKGFGDQLELTTRTFTSVEVLSKLEKSPE